MPPADTPGSAPPRTRVLSGVQPSGDLHLGNFVGAFRNWVTDQHEHDAFFCIVDLHALTLDHDPAALAPRTLEVTEWLLATGLDPDVCTLFVQSHVAEHTGLAWLLECVATFGELRRMTQFKDKSGGGQEAVRAGLFTYPVLMAADILLYDADRVPVGDDQRQHLELTRNVAQRFNARYGDTFVVPEAAIPKVAARVMDLQEPTRKMSKSTGTDAGLIYLADRPEVISKKIRRAVTDTGDDVVFDPVARPGVANLLSLLAAATGEDPKALAGKYTQYGPLKADTSEAVVEMLRPVQQRHAELAADPATTRALLAAGAERARSVASPTLARARRAVGLLDP
ncbi:MAG TPA: tryptophan--tRNA ligase [Acidimicrobiales bacterium]|nr:tryptophan--tRNA ligase [Acidimicrobiales bacterium]